MKSLIITEKSSVADLVAKALGGLTQKDGFYEGNNVIVAPAQGHLVRQDFQASGDTTWSMDNLPILPERFDLHVIARTQKIYKTLADLIARKDVSTLINACDSGREGELIFRLIYKKTGTNKPIQRMWFSSVVLGTIKKAYDDVKPGSDYEDLANSAFSRAESDWIIGINATRAMSVLHAKKTGQSGGASLANVGRVLMPTLFIPVLREREIKNFKPQNFWQIKAKFKNEHGVYESTWTRPKNQEDESDDESLTRFLDKAKAEEILKKCQAGEVEKVDDLKELVESKPPQLYDLVALQYEVNKKYKLPIAKVEDIAQKLYEMQCTTYPRTDANVLETDYADTAVETLEALLNNSPYKSAAQYALDNDLVKKNLSNKRVFNNDLIRDHFAIIPTGEIPTGLSDMEQKVYDLIVKRFIAVFYPNAEYEKTVRTTLLSGETFKTSGRILKSKGWLEVYGQQEENKKEELLCPLSETLPSVDSIKLNSGVTKPPKRYTQGTLAKAMENAGQFIEDDEKELRKVLKAAGLGRPQGRSRIVENLLSAQTTTGIAKEPYLIEVNNELIPTAKGMDCIAELENAGIEVLVSPKMTAVWEQKLLDMEDGKYSRSEFMREINELTTDIIAKFKTTYEQTESRKLNANCPKCNSELQVDGKRFSCTGCDWAFWGEVASKRLLIEDVEQLLNKGKTELIDGFYSTKHERHFSAYLVLNKETGQANFELPPPETVDTGCPKCKKSSLVSNDKSVRCKEQSCDFIFWREIAQKKLTDNQIKELLSKGTTKLIKGFKSKAGKAFEAQLKFNNETFKAEFVFPERGKSA